jgi:DNA-binding transcriptional MerR regulator
MSPRSRWARHEKRRVHIVEKVRYMISDAAQIAGVESHVLRYWEDELGLEVPRNELGHRYYTRENIQEFQRIKELKEQGYQLKAIRMILHGEDPGAAQLQTGADAACAFGTGSAQKLQHETVGTDKSQPEQALAGTGGTYRNGQTDTANGGMFLAEQAQKRTMPAAGMTVQPAGGVSLSAEERMDQFRELMSDIVGRAISQNNEELSQTIGVEVQERVLKEMDYLVREQEDAAEERYKKLDAAIRGSVHKKKSLFAKDKSKTGKKEKKDAGKLLGQPT